ncbi:glutamate receptor ionotropic, delta-2-like [Branchiostoma lanceolatum]|uniref:glutamate receptor ionotropic, delta-2-like n=1 Tax=Branchiostoma lanceolatum TaxID=7740 RepID=UPI0034511826
MPSLAQVGAIFDAPGTDEEVAFQAGVHDVNRKRLLFEPSQTTIETKVTYLGNMGPYAAAFQVCQMLQSDVVAILSHVTCQDTATLTSLTSELRIPHLTTNTCPDVDLGEFLLSVTPDPTHVDLALAAYMTDSKWEQIVIFYDKDTNFNRIQTILGTSPENKMAMTIFRVPPVPRTDYDSNIYRILSRIEGDGVKLNNVLILCDVPNTMQLLAQAFVSEPVREGSYWLIGNPEVSDDDVKNTIGTVRGVITTIRHVFDLSDAARDLVSTLPAKITRDFIQNGGKTVIPYSKADLFYTFDAVRFLAQAVRQRVVADKHSAKKGVRCDENGTSSEPGKHGEVIMSTLKQRTWKGSLGGVAFGPSGHNSRVEYEFLSLKTVNKTVQFTPTGTWSERAGLNMTQRLDWPDIQGVKLRVVTVEDIPFVFEQNHPSGVGYDGFSIDVIKELSKTLNFSFVVYGVADKKYGAPRPDGTWNGMIGDVVNKQADVAIAAMTITKEREKVVDFPKRYMDQSFGILMKKPKDNTRNVFGFMGPFTPEVWACIGGSVVIVGVFLYLLNKFRPDDILITEEGESPPRFGLNDSLWFIIGSLMQQGWDWSPRCLSHRLLSGFWWLFSLVVISTYTANLAAFLTVTRMENPIRTENLGEVDVREGNYAFIWDTPIIEYVALNDPDCSLTTAENSFYERGYGIALQRDSPYREAFSYGILQMQENGRMNKLKERWWPTTGRCSLRNMTAKKRASALGLNNFAGVFYVMMVGLVLSVIMALCESLWHMCRRGRFPLNWKTRRRAANTVSDLDTVVEVDRKKNGHIQVVTTIRIPEMDKNSLPPLHDRLMSSKETRC